MYKTGHAFKDVDELCERLISVWCELDQSFVNHAIDDEGGHFERYL